MVRVGGGVAEFVWGGGVTRSLRGSCCIDSSTVDFPISRFPFFMSFYLSVSKIRDGGNERVSLLTEAVPETPESVLHAKLRKLARKRVSRKESQKQNVWHVSRIRSIFGQRKNSQGRKERTEEKMGI